MTFPGQIKRTPLPAEEGQVCLGRNSPHVENHESLTETVKWLKEKNERLAERVELLEELSKKTSAAEDNEPNTVTWEEFINSTTFHGIRYLFAKGFLMRRVTSTVEKRMFNFINSFFSSTNKTGLENDSEILNLTNGLNTTKFLLDTDHQKEDLIHNFEFLNFFAITE